MILSVNFDKREDLEIFLQNYDFEKYTFCGIKVKIDVLTIEWEELNFAYEDGLVGLWLDGEELFEFKNQDQVSIKKACDDISRYMDIE